MDLPFVQMATKDKNVVAKFDQLRIHTLPRPHTSSSQSRSPLIHSKELTPPTDNNNSSNSSNSNNNGTRVGSNHVTLTIDAGRQTPTGRRCHPRDGLQRADTKQLRRPAGFNMRATRDALLMGVRHRTAVGAYKTQAVTASAAKAKARVRSKRGRSYKPNNNNSNNNNNNNSHSVIHHITNRPTRILKRISDISSTLTAVMMLKLSFSNDFIVCCQVLVLFRVEMVVKLMGQYRMV